jgi:hypothetical protein
MHRTDTRAEQALRRVALPDLEQPGAGAFHQLPCGVAREGNGKDRLGLDMPVRDGVLHLGLEPMGLAGPGRGRDDMHRAAHRIASFPHNLGSAQ